jgi:hypothetical protein
MLSAATMNRWNRRCGSIEICPVSMSTITNYYSSGQHKEDGKSRQKHDTKDTMIFASFLEERNPFINEENFRNIETGVSATMDVNADNAKQVGDRILSSMENKSVSLMHQ